MRRHALGVFAVLLLATAATLTVSYWGEPMDPALLDLQSASLRIGMLLGVVWLAYDRLARIPVWLAVAFTASLAVILCARRFALVLIPLIFLASFLGGLGRRRRPR